MINISKLPYLYNPTLEEMDRGGYNRGYDDRDQMRGGYGDSSGYDRGYQRAEEYPARRMNYEAERYDGFYDSTS